VIKTTWCRLITEVSLPVPDGNQYTAGSPLSVGPAITLWISAFQ
jgi:hypothetical protein